MNTQVHTTLANLLYERKYDEIIKISQSFLSKNSLDLSAHYCAAIAYLASTNIPQGITHLQEIVGAYSHFSLREDSSTNIFIGYSALQVALLMEFFFREFTGNIIRADEIYQCATVAKAIGQKYDDKTLYEPAEQIFQHLWPVSPKKTSEIKNFFPRPDSPICLQLEPTC